MDKASRLSLLAILLSVPAAAQTRARVQAPTVPVIGGPAMTGAALAGLRAPALSNPSLPTLTMPSVMPTASVLPTVPAFSPIISARVASASLGTPASAASVANAATPEAPKAEKPGMASLEAAAKPFADSLGRTTPQAGAMLGTTFDASMLQRADEAASVIPGVRPWPRVSGVGLARPFNGVSEEGKAQTPAPKKSDDERPMGKWERVGTGLLLALCLAGSLFAWYTMYASMGQVMQMGEQQIEQQYYGPVPTIDEIFGGR